MITLLFVFFVGAFALPDCDLKEASVSDCVATLSHQYTVKEDKEFRNVEFNCQMDRHDNCIHVNPSIKVQMNFVDIKGGNSGRCILLDSAAELTADTLIVEGCGGNSHLGGHHGAVIYGEDNVITISNSRFHKNFGKYGGAIYVTANSQLTVRDSYFTDNEAHGLGGAIHSDHSTVHITNCTFNLNKASAPGGALSAYNSHVNVNKATIVENMGDVSGGALYLARETKLVIKQTQIHKNSAPDHTDGIFCHGDTDGQCDIQIDHATYDTMDDIALHLCTIDIVDKKRPQQYSRL